MTVAKDRAERLEGMCARVEEIRPVLEPEDMLPDTDMVHEAIDGVLNARTGLLLAGNPRFGDRPIANVFRRILRWHGTGGTLDSLMMARWDCGSIVRSRGLGITEGELFNRLLTLSLVLRHGDSPATDRWVKVLGHTIR